ncbi:response regulator [Amphibacillus xylanus]|uniref:Putative two-component system response regulator n=1 Tax=Amphibacillus xylanus (strain ATCC 51415 / DSM 6626 / JCM 7361 / LMG 17667 / NBRC 15112 / Ep01) TaxID=698758 RepID=K0IZH4_AMPXN|nr:response regulator [Amphibacillus xylanus]BAM47955.1 putative two-component system response regulator [Amphibacillus xylanus NBRC 15112]
MLEICIIDDEPLALQYLRFLLNQIDDVKVTGAYSDPQKLINHIRTKRVDTVLMDIQMPGITGIELAEQLLMIQPKIEIVFVTAYDEYAIKAFEINALDYILKPIQKHRLELSINRIKEELAENITFKTDQATFVINNLGKLSIEKNGQPISIKWRTTKAKELFACFTQGHLHSFRKAKLISEMWGNLAWDNASSQLYSSVYQIRRVLQKANIPIEIVSQDEYYKVNLSSVKIMSIEWKQAVLNLLDAENPSVSNFIELLKIYQGDYLEDIKQDWAIPERNGLRELWIQFIQYLIDLIKEQEEQPLHLIAKIKSLVRFDQEVLAIVEERTSTLNYH